MFKHFELSVNLSLFKKLTVTIQLHLNNNIQLLQQAQQQTSNTLIVESAILYNEWN